MDANAGAPAPPAASAAAAGAAAKPGPATVEQCSVLQQVIKLLEHTEEAKKMLPLANMTAEMLQTTLQVCVYAVCPAMSLAMLLAGHAAAVGQPCS